MQFSMTSELVYRVTRVLFLLAIAMRTISAIASIEELTSDGDQILKSRALVAANGKIVLKKVSLSDFRDKSTFRGTRVEVYEGVKENEPEVQSRSCTLPPETNEIFPKLGSPLFSCIQAYYVANEVLKNFEKLGFKYNKPLKVLVNYKPKKIDEETPPAWALNGTVIHIEHPKFRNMLFYPEVITHEISHVILNELVMTRPMIEYKLGSLNEGAADLFATLMTGIRELGKDSRLDRPGYSRNMVNDRFFGMSNAEGGYGQSNPLVSTLVEFDNFLSKRKTSHATWTILKTLLNTLHSLKVEDGTVEFFELFRRQFRYFEPDLSGTLRVLDKILFRHGLRRHEYFTGVFVNGDFWDKQWHDHFDLSKDGQNHFELEVKPGVQSLMGATFPLHVYLLPTYPSSHLEQDLAVIRKCRKSKRLAKSETLDVQCLDNYFKEPLDLKDWQFPSRLILVSEPGMQTSHFLATKRTTIQMIVVDDEGISLGDQMHSWGLNISSSPYSKRSASINPVTSGY